MNYSFPSVMNDSTKPPIPEVGYRFHPTHAELIYNYLKPKIRGDDVEDLSLMPEVHVCKHEPWELPDKSKMKSKDAEWYFFCPRDFKYLNSSRSNRRTKLGFWKPTGKNLPIRFKGTKKVIGIRKTLVFYTKASPKPLRTGWIIHEYEYISDLSLSNEGNYVLCKLKKKPDEKTNKGEPNHHVVSISDPKAAPNCGIEGECESSMEMPSKFINHSTCGYGERIGILDLDFDNPNLDKEAYISAPDEGERNSHTVMPSCLENGNPWEKTEEGCLRSSVVSPENIPTDAWRHELLELIPCLLEEVKASISEVEDNLPNPFQPAASESTEKISLRNGFDAPSVKLQDFEVQRPSKVHGYVERKLLQAREFVLCKLKKDPEAIMPTYEEGESSSNREFVLCKLKKDPEAIMPTYEEGESSSNVTSHHLENQNSNEYNHPQNFGEGGYGAPMPSYFTTNEQEEDIYQIQLHLNSFRNYDGMGDYNLDAALQDPYYGDM
ncbi:hypothetical protein SADUNF_Sadunf14G0078300 [Salix dunnii]|uniref:NAC domain-containing protein n=1 Tax=Salix dunnii TaxID=1413687 RepID=A0A835JDF5_9ROSI|nr:hypothetical protein SADUNF_Sadunf14G0078300 [Salix dunnii]